MFADNGTYTVTLTVTDSFGDSSRDSLTVTVNNVAPSPVIALISDPLQEGTAITVRGLVRDPAGVNDIVTLAWTVFKNGSTSAYATGTGSTFRFTPDDDGGYRVVLTASDKDGGSASAAQAITVNNVKPQNVNAGADQTVNEGDIVNLSGSFNDPGSADTHTLSWSVVASNGEVVSNGSGANFSFVPHDNGTYTVTFSVTDDDGGVGTDSATIDVTNVAPVISGAISGPTTAVVFQPLSYSVAGFTDVGQLDTHTTAWQVLNSSSTVVASGAGLSIAFTPTDIGTFTVRFTVTDDDTGSDTADVSLTVSAAPGKITGGGSIDSGVRNFGFVVQPAQNGGFKGNLEFQDKSAGNNFNLKSTSITLISVYGNKGMFTGAATKNGVSGFTFRADVEDNGEPGAGVDKFRIRVYSGATLIYDSSSLATKGGILDKGGNIQIHKSGNALTSAASGGSSDGAAVDDGAQALVTSAGQILVGVLGVSVHDDEGSLAADQRARINDAIIGLNDAFGSFGLTLVEVDSASGPAADFQLQTAWTSPCGNAADGVLGCTTDTGELIVLKGWNWYAGANNATVGTEQYDYQTIVTHELGHSLGLGHSSNAGSVMYATLSAGVARRTLAVGDIAVETEDETGPAALFAAGAALVPASTTTQGSVTSVAAVRPSDGGALASSFVRGIPATRHAAKVTDTLAVSDNDRLIGGRTTSDHDDLALRQALAEWVSVASYQNRVAAIDSLLTVLDDLEQDELTAGSDRDLFFASLGDDLIDVKSKKGAETVL